MSRFYFAIAPGDFAVRIIGYRAKIVQKPLDQYSFVQYAKRRCRADLLTTESKEVNTFRKYIQKQYELDYEGYMLRYGDWMMPAIE